MNINIITLFLDVITFGIYGALKNHKEILRERTEFKKRKQ